MGFFLLRSAATITTAVAASAVPAALALASSHHRSPAPPSSCSVACSCSIRFPRFQNPSFLSLSHSSSHVGSSATVRGRDSAPSVLHMDVPASDLKPTSQNGAVLPELLIEYMVDMKCEGEEQVADC